MAHCERCGAEYLTERGHVCRKPDHAYLIARLRSYEILAICNEAADALEALVRERDAAQQDAAQYKKAWERRGLALAWLLNDAPPHLCVRWWQRITAAGSPQPDSHVSGTALDGAIDAAIKDAP